MIHVQEQWQGTNIGCEITNLAVQLESRALSGLGPLRGQYLVGMEKSLRINRKHNNTCALSPLD